MEDVSPAGDQEMPMRIQTSEHCRDGLPEDGPIVLSPSLHERLLATVRQRHPQKSYGYLLSDGDPRTPTDFILFEDNIRNTSAWKPRFESYGRYFVEHDDAGFVATPEESWRLQKEIWARGMVEVGVFHSHLRHPANFSQIDYELHSERFDALWHLIISMRSPERPQLRIFAVSHGRVRELEVRAPGAPQHGRSASNQPPVDAAACNLAIRRARLLLALDRAGHPRCRESAAILQAMDDLLATEHAEAIDELLVRGFLRDSGRRYQEYVAPHMSPLNGGRFQMGTSRAHARHFCGETPRHVVELSPYHLAQTPVTNELYGLFDPSRRDVPACARRKPVVSVTWFDATLFALWMGCRLPTEAEWEFACGGGAESEWCCSDESLLSRYAWYSENSAGETHPVATRDPNALGLFDLHGNVWEWCQDIYDQDYYARSPIRDPVNPGASLTQEGATHGDRVCRGGSRQLFAEMCRTRYRFHEPADFWAADLGFRLARSGDMVEMKGD